MESERNEIEKNFEIIYGQFRLQLYRHIFDLLGDREGSLTATEFFAAEVIYLLGNPTVKKFADFLNINSAHAAYKVRSLTEKGYLEKEASERDRRSCNLKVTEKFLKYYHREDSYGTFVFDRLKEHLSADELADVNRLFEKFILSMRAEGEKI